MRTPASRLCLAALLMTSALAEAQDLGAEHGSSGTDRSGPTSQWPDESKPPTTSACEAEVKRLRALVKALDTKIGLLEEKVERLQKKGNP
jgi:hypothetical protein